MLYGYNRSNFCLYSTPENLRISRMRKIKNGHVPIKFARGGLLPLLLPQPSGQVNTQDQIVNGKFG